jgi:hypothetical protein
VFPEDLEYPVDPEDLVFPRDWITSTT